MVTAGRGGGGEGEEGEGDERERVAGGSGQATERRRKRTDAARSIVAFLRSTPLATRGVHAFVSAVLVGED